jgi:hypothetical protein
MNNSNPSLKHFKDEHHISIANANTYSELKDVALDVLKNMPQPIVTVCGPLSTGGLGSVEKNLEVFEKTIHKLSLLEKNVFNQLFFEKRIGQLIRSSDKSKEESDKTLLEEFYLHIFKSGLIKKLYFIHGWESSYGANWERKTAQKLGIKVEDLPIDFIDKE